MRGAGGLKLIFNYNACFLVENVDLMKIEVSAYLVSSYIFNSPTLFNFSAFVVLFLNAF